jgi:DNA-binding response OmpR family regulator
MFHPTILFLASDSVIRGAIVDVLKAEGYNVFAAGDIGVAEEMLTQHRPDLLMIRHYTGSISGHDAAMYLRIRSPGLPVLIVGGLLETERLANYEAFDGFEVFPKPFKAAELLAKVKEVLAKHPVRELL